MPTVIKIPEADFVTGLLTGSGLVLFILYLLFRYPNAAKKYFSWFLLILSFVWKKFEYHFIKSEIEGKLNSFVTRIEGKTDKVFPRVRIKWVTDDSREEIFKEDFEIILVFKDRKSQSKNLAKAALMFVSDALLIKATRYLSKNQKLAVELFTTQKILLKENRAAYEQFVNEYVVPRMHENDKVKGFLTKFENIDRADLYYPLLIQELDYLGYKMFSPSPGKEIFSEINLLISFLHKFSLREIGDDTIQDTFDGKFTRCGIRIVSSRWVRDTGKIEGPKNRVLKAVKYGLENIYIIGSNEKQNKNFLDQVINSVLETQPNLKVLFETTLDNRIKIRGEFRQTKSYLIRLHNPTEVKGIYLLEDIRLHK